MPQGLDANHIQLAMASLKIMEDKLIDQYKELYLFEALIGFLSTISFPIASPFPAIAMISFSLAPFTGLTLLSNAHTVVVEAIGYLITVMWAKEFILLVRKGLRCPCSSSRSALCCGRYRSTGRPAPAS